MKFLLTILIAFFVVVFFVGLFRVVHAVDSIPAALEERAKERAAEEKRLNDWAGVDSGPTKKR